MNIIQAYVRVPLVKRVVAGLLLGALCGGALWSLSAAFGCKEAVQAALRYCSPFGTVFIGMLKMIVVPTVFFSLVSGASALPLKRLGRVGGKVVGWYFATMAFAAALGIALALWINPGAGASLTGWQELARQFGSQTRSIAGSDAPKTLVEVLEKLLSDFFQNPFAALANGNFLGVIAFAILFGISVRLVLESSDDPQVQAKMRTVTDLCDACLLALNRIIDFVMNYSPIGVFFLSMGIFSVYGPSIIGPYVTVLAGVACGVLLLLFVAYPLLIAVVVRKNPYKILAAVREVMLFAFVTRSSAATLPVTIRVAEENLGISRELASFSLPLGATVNMDGVCIHLPMFAILAANMFGIHLTFGDLAVMTVTTVLAAVGAGGVPGGSLMLLFIILGAIGLNPSQTAVIVALALGINPILDMFETMCNVTGDILCTYSVASLEGLAQGDVHA
ncbi:MAG TPA: dicarboxylate/amino acid:cation symporter [Kiritimatiellia bacterium]|nr:dicarboxylate/amino acid:cation symporter [Kiritimatiellia bacterium]HPS09450.1 dicarboxylate/amino acid:cation symporter [Kiritimatiellia bacterium]